MRAPQREMLSGLVGAVALFGLASCSTTVASAPSQPAYDTDVRPILMAHCARCHGAGDAINVPTEPTGPDAAVEASIANTAAMLKATNIYLDRYSSEGTKTGAYVARNEFALIFPPTNTKPEYLMPPPPAPGLSDFELDVLKAWAASSAPCSNDPNPDKSVCPNGPGAGP
ncbi:MAG TPA: hypothetical protein VHM31_03350 [Polyangia bacterium]|nr:hypothetical protein [Polyangia bacterium]